jgi:membrane-associated phospholipid phosphatase
MGKKKQHKARAAIEAADIAISQDAATLRDSKAVALLGAVGDMGDQPPMVAWCLATLIGGVSARDPRLARAGARMLAAHALATAVKALVKRSVDRTRPALLVDEGRYRVGPGEHDEGPYNSFPSGHTAGAVAVARAWARAYPEQRGAAYGAAATVALVQLPRCAHFPSDLVAGAAIGWIAEAAASALIDRLPAAPPAAG